MSHRQQDELETTFPTRRLPYDIVRAILDDHHTLIVYDLLTWLKALAPLEYTSSYLRKTSNKDRAHHKWMYLKELHGYWEQDSSRQIFLVFTRFSLTGFNSQQAQEVQEIICIPGVREAILANSAVSIEFMKACSASIVVLRDIPPTESSFKCITDFRCPRLNTIHVTLLRNEDPIPKDVLALLPSSLTSLSLSETLSGARLKILSTFNLKYLHSRAGESTMASVLPKLEHLSFDYWPLNFRFPSRSYDSLQVLHTCETFSVVWDILPCPNLKELRCRLDWRSLPQSYTGSQKLVKVVFLYSRSFEFFNAQIQRFISSLINCNSNLEYLACPVLCNDEFLKQVTPTRIRTLYGFKFAIDDQWTLLNVAFPCVTDLTVLDTVSWQLGRVLQTLPNITTLGLDYESSDISLCSHVMCLSATGQNIRSLSIIYDLQPVDTSLNSLKLLLDVLPNISQLTLKIELTQSLVRALIGRKNLTYLKVLVRNPVWVVRGLLNDSLPMNMQIEICEIIYDERFSKPATPDRLSLFHSYQIQAQTVFH